jgi:hypothetical protein
MNDQTPPRKDELQMKRELADAAKELMDNKAFAQAILELRKRWFELMLTELNLRLRDEQIAMIKALEAIPAELTIIMNNYKMALRQKQHG